MIKSVPSEQIETAIKPPLGVDLDGTLLRSDVLLEQLLQLIRQHPALLLRLPFWLLRGKVHVKAQLARHTDLDVSVLPYRQELLSYLEEERLLGRKLILATATHRQVAERIASHLGLFDEVVATDSTVNISGMNKAAALAEASGGEGFVYAGNAPIDRAVWQEAKGAIVVGRQQHLTQGLNHVEGTFPETFQPKDILRAVRLHQWVKNILVFVPLFLTHQVFNLGALGETLLAFFAFCLCASSVYVLNDLLDLEADRHHVRKRFRPFASGNLPIRFGLMLAPLLLLGAALMALWVSPAFLGALGLYYVSTLSYSLYLKRKPIIDVLMLALLYVMRVVAGGIAIGAVLSPWLLAFGMFFFLSVAYVKRYSELRVVEEGGSLRARGYAHADLEGLADLGVSSGYVSALVVALYINSDDVARYYQSPSLLWLVCPLLVYWLSRVWLLARRGKMHDDPIVFALSDKVSYVVGALIVGIALLATVGIGGL